MFHKFPKIQNLESLTDKEWQEFKSPINKYIITEKIDGSNGAITLDLDENSNHQIQIYTRNGNQFQPETTAPFIEDFTKLRNCFLDVKKNIDKNFFLHLLLKDCNEVNVAGEFFGSWVMNRIDYGRAIDFAVFSLGFYQTDGSCVVVNPITTASIIEYSKANLKVIPHSDYKMYLDVGENTFRDECKMSIPSYYANQSPKKKEKTYLEGYVVYSINNNDKFGFDCYTLKGMAKIKDPNFKDNAKGKADDKKDEIKELNSKYNELISENRLMDAISKFGGKLENKQFGEFIKFVIQDALEDFKHDYLDKVERLKKNLEKQIYKVSSDSVNKITKFAKDHTK